MSGGVAVDGKTRLYGILGHPVASSLSPAMHNAAFRALALNAAYLPFPVHPEDLTRAVPGLVAAGVAGFNLTVPHKTAILPLLDELSPLARKIGAVNTVRCENGRLHGTSTDGEGFLLSLTRDMDWRPEGRKVLLLGAGGAARGIAFALLEAGIGRLAIANRTPARAESLAEDCRRHFPQRKVEALPLEAIAGTGPDLLINATTLGMGDGVALVDPKTVMGGGWVADIVYSPLETPLLRKASDLGLETVNGLGMLLHQGGLAFQFWTGREPPLEVMREALNAGLAARGDGVD